MISAYCDIKDPYVIHGIKHFFWKYGFQIKVNSNDGSKIAIIYDNSDDVGEFQILVIANKIQDEIKGWLKAEKINEVPIFETPFDLNSSGQALVIYHTDNEKYPCVVYSDNKIRINFDIFKEIGYILTGHLDKMWNKMDTKEKRKIARISIIDCYEEILFSSVLLAGQKLNVPIVQKAFWPDGKKFAVCLTHDVDELKKTYQYFTRSVRHLKIGEFGRAWYHLKSFFTDKFLGKNPYWTFDDIMRIENELNVRSTFFFLKETAKVNILKPATWHHYARRYDFQNPKIAELIKELASTGWEVALHGSYESYKDKTKLREEKEYLEKTLGNKVYGIRQHHLNLRIPETWRYQEEIGLEYDTSLGFKEDVGFRWGTCFPFHPYNNGKAMSILEIPLTIMDISLTLNSNKNIWTDCMNVVNEVEKYGGVLTLLWHHAVFNDEEYPGWAEMYEKIIKLCKEKNAWVATAGEITKWWKMREESRVECAYEDNTLKIIPYPKSQKHFINVYLPKGKTAEVSSENAEIISEGGNPVTIRTKTLEKNGEILLEMR